MRAEQGRLQLCADRRLDRNYLSCLVRLHSAIQVFNPAGLPDLGVGVVNGSLWMISLELKSYQLALWLLLDPLLWAVMLLSIGLIPCCLLHFSDVLYGLYVFHMPLANTLFLLYMIDSARLMPYIGSLFVLAALSSDWDFVEQPALARNPSLRPVFIFTSIN